MAAWVFFNYAENGSGQNGTDKMVWTKCYVDKMVLNKMVADKMARTKWHGQNVKLTKCYQTKW